jgi:hypothetical protein
MIRVFKRYGEKGVSWLSLSFFVFFVSSFFFFGNLSIKLLDYSSTSKKYTGYIKEKTITYTKDKTGSIEDTVYSLIINFDSIGKKVLEIDKKTFDSKHVNSYIIHRYKNSELEELTNPTNGEKYFFNFATLFLALASTMAMSYKGFHLLYLILISYKIVYISNKHREIDPYNEEEWDEDKINFRQQLKDYMKLFKKK